MSGASSEYARNRPLTPQGCSSESGYHVKTILKALRRGELVGYQRGKGCTWRVYPDDLHRWIRGEKPGKRRAA